MLRKHLVYVIINAFFILLSVGLSVFGQAYAFSIYGLSLIFLLVQVFKHLNFKSVFFWFVLSYIGLFYLSPLFEFIFPGEVLIGSVSTIKLYNFLNIISIHVFCTFYFLFYRESSKSNLKIMLSRKNLNYALYVMGILTMIAAIWMFFSVGGIAAIKYSRIDLKYVQSGKGLSLLLTYFSSTFFVLFGILIAKKKYNILYSLIFLVILSILEFIYFISLRNRTMILMHLLAIIIGIIISKNIFFNDYKYQNMYIFNKVKVLPLVIALTLLGVLGIFVRFARGVYLEGSGELEISLKQMIITSVQSGDIGYANMTIRVLEYANVNDLHLNGQSYYRLLLAIVPKSIYNNDVPTTDSLIGQKLTGLDVMTIPPGIFGDAYINFGLFGFVVFILYGIFLGYFDRAKKILISYMFFALSFTFIYHFVRGSFVNVLISLIVIYCGIYVTNRILKPEYI